MISVYIGNDEIYAIDASVKKSGIVSVNRVYSMKIDVGSIINGVIVNEDALKFEIRKFWKENSLPKKDINLVINSKQILMKNMTLPNINPKKLGNLISMEFADSEKSNPIYDYMVLNVDSKKKKMDTIVVDVEMEFVEKYKSIFNDLDIKISSFTSGLTNIIKIFNNSKNSSFDGNCLIQILDGNNLVSIIFSDGVYSYSQSVRIFSEPNDPGFVGEVVNNISSTMQFYMSTSKADISKIFFFWINKGIFSELKNALTLYNAEVDFIPEIEEVNFNNNGDMSQYAYGIGTFIKGKKDINLLKSVGEVEKGKEIAGIITVKNLVILGILLIVMVISSVALIVRNLILTKSIDEVSKILNNANNQEMLAKINAIQSDAQGLENKINDIEKTKSAILTYPIYNSKVRDIILSCQDSVTSLNIISFDAKSGIIRIEARCVGANYTHSLVDKLNATGIFTNIEYNGYNYDTSSNVYKVNVDCTLKESIGF